MGCVWTQRKSYVLQIWEEEFEPQPLTSIHALVYEQCQGLVLQLELLTKHHFSKMFFTSIPCPKLLQIWWQTFQHQFFFFVFSSFLKILQKPCLHLLGIYLTKKELHNHTTTFSFSSLFLCQKLAWCDGAYIRKGGTNNQENKNGKKWGKKNCPNFCHCGT